MIRWIAGTGQHEQEKITGHFVDTAEVDALAASSENENRVVKSHETAVWYCDAVTESCRGQTLPLSQNLQRLRFVEMLI